MRVHGSQYTEFEGIRVHHICTEFGDVSSRNRTRLVVHLSHGFGANALGWDRLIDQLAPSICEIYGAVTFVAQDRVGFGLTERPSVRTSSAGEVTTPYDFDFNARAGVALVTRLLQQYERTDADATGAPHLLMIGHSMGGPHAMAIAAEAEVLRACGRLCGAVLIAPACVLPLDRAELHAQTLISRREIAGGSYAHSPHRIGFVLFGGLVRVLPRRMRTLLRSALIYLAHAAVRSPRFWFYALRLFYHDKTLLNQEMVSSYAYPASAHSACEGLVSFLFSLVDYTEGTRDAATVDKLAASCCQVLVLQGTDDALVLPQCTKVLVEALIDARRRGAADEPHASIELKEIDQCGHMPQEEKVVELARHIMTLIASHNCPNRRATLA